MAKQDSRKRSLTKSQLSTRIAAGAGVSKEEVVAVLDAMATEIERNLCCNGPGVFVIPDLAEIKRATVPACPTWPTKVKVALVPTLLPGLDAYCRRGLHTYFRSPATNARGQPVCGSCANDQIDWKRLHRRDIADIEYVIPQLKTDRWHYGWWHKDLDFVAIKRAVGKGPVELRNAAQRRIEQSVGRVYLMKNGAKKPFRDGGQTPFAGNIIYYGQHATATCCRNCIEVWHGIPQGRELTKRENFYLVELLMAYLLPQIANLEAVRWPGGKIKP